MNTTARNRFTLLFGAVPLLLAGGDHWARGWQLLGAVTLLVATLNLVALPFTQRLPVRAFVLVSLLNAAVALSTAYAYQTDAKTGLPFVWIVAGLLYLYAAYQFYRRLSSP